MNRFIFASRAGRLAPLSLVLLSLAGCARSDAEGSAEALLFADGGSALSASERQQIVALLDVRVSPEGDSLLDPFCERPMEVSVSVRDLDGNGTQEVIVVGGNTCTSGGLGRSLTMFVKTGSGDYAAHLGFPVGEYDLVPAEAGLPTVRVLGFRPCAGFWSWDGTAYQHVRNEPLEPEGCEL